MSNVFVYRYGRVGFSINNQVSEGVDYQLLEQDPFDLIDELGFEYKLRGVGPRILDCVNERIPFLTKVNCTPSGSSVVITPEGCLMRLDVFQDETKLCYDIHHIPQGAGTLYSLVTDHQKSQIVTAALMAWRDERKFQRDLNKFFHIQRVQMVWFDFQELMAEIKRKGGN